MYSAHGLNDFLICCGFKGYVIKEYFSNYFLHMSDVTFDMRNSRFEVHHKRVEPWAVTLVDTGDETMTGGRLLRVFDYLKDDEEFCLTYGDGVGDVDLIDTIAFHRAHRKLATLTATFPPGRFGALNISGNRVLNFQEKPKGNGGLINAGFFVLNPGVLKYLKNDATVWEQEPLMNLAADGELMAYEHHGFWQPMDTLRDKHYLENLWASGRAPWKGWA
jgi:glucose-1-phosphate cytidylyltransferase